MLPIRTILLAALPVCITGVARADTPSALQQQLSAILAGSVSRSGIPGRAAIITCQGKLVWSDSAGFSVTETGLPFRQNTLSSVASVTKMFTATIVLRMAEDGLLSIQSPIAPYLPASIPGAQAVTIEDLLGMRSGYADIENSPAFIAAANEPNHVWTRAQFFGAIQAPHFPPGTEEEYSNVNFLLLSAIIAKTYPGGVNAAFDHYVAEPAGLGSSVYFARIPDAAYRFAHGYQTSHGHTHDVDKGARYLGVNTSVWGTIWGDGGVGATARGLARFADGLYAGRLVSAATLAAMEAPLQTSAYGLGMERFRYDGHYWYGHVGAFEGYTAIIAHDIERDVTLAGVANGLVENDPAQSQVVFELLSAYDAAPACGAQP